jgi:hypothetical protein
LRVDRVGILVRRGQIGLQPDRIAFIANNETVQLRGLRLDAIRNGKTTDSNSAKPAAANGTETNGMIGTHRHNSVAMVE